MTAIVDENHKAMASKIRDILALYEENADLISIGAYKAGANARLDNAVARIDAINRFLKQSTTEFFDYEEVLEGMTRILE